MWQNRKLFTFVGISNFADEIDSPAFGVKQQVPTGPPVDCVWGSFGPWSECSATCGARGSQTRKRVALREAANGGKDCRGGNEERRSCNTKSCPPLQVKRNFYRGILSPKEGQATSGLTLGHREKNSNENKSKLKEKTRNTRK